MLPSVKDSVIKRHNSSDSPALNRVSFEFVVRASTKGKMFFLKNIESVISPKFYNNSKSAGRLLIASVYTLFVHDFKYTQ